MNTSTQCVVAGGGPAGMALGLLLARAGIDVVVLEKHADFLRDFRGDTVHASTLTLLDELGMGERFAALPHRTEQHIDMIFDDGTVTQDLTRLPGRHQHIALVPQWDFLSMLVEVGTQSPHLQVVMNAEVVDLIRTGGRVSGVIYRNRTTGREHDLRADLVVGCDGRNSRVREALGLPRISFGSPFDALFTRVPRTPDDPDRTLLRFSSIGGLVMINRTDYWQIALLIGKGEGRRALRDDAAFLRSGISALEPRFAARISSLTAADVAQLEIRIDRLRRWWTPGALCIGDAAHAMSPIAGVGINLAVQDAVATARSVVPGLRRGFVPDRALAAVQRRRMLPTVLTQGLQRAAERRFVATPVEPRDTQPPALRIPQPLRTLRHLPALPHLMGRMVGIGLRPEHLTGPLARPAA
ncbi:FAD-dependent oxidoreductase [Pseudonocardia sp. TRM90224]|uniref:FAD-dependent oxidoreductase n=1 Tax=Pseudonocardia sp. TRM90224 TaxID=2812678 RepID=UPI001E2E2365|nr:FAD-dependent oxidoreductase [Pseudonocardia sp. TRM90224]